MTTALLFPGQGEQRPGMLHDLPDHPAVARTLDEISDALDLDVRTLDTAEALRSNAAAQLALFSASLATYRALHALGVRPEHVAGHSIGAFAAAVACGALTLGDAARAVRVRGAAMERAYPSGYGMGVVLGLPEPAVVRIVESVHTPESPVHPANVNAPLQIAVSGALPAVDRVLALALEHGAAKARRLAVSVPAHCPLMAAARAELAAHLARVPFTRPGTPFAGNAGGRTLRTAEAVHADLVDSLTRPVRWHEATCVLRERGVDLFVQVSPGDTLARLAATAFPEARVTCLRADTPEHVAELVAWTAGQRARHRP
ncbi:ACP S-malonyltransferase (plasmid) [Streptomyces sp. BI20]|uniref:ACP S-malonyltransferase n=1 Tax=Streptomyces sp. BI20 TaxID=3403460 RepID=UPI003C70B624